MNLWKEVSGSNECMTGYPIFLMQVLQYLALREILTPEHITSGPHCAGVERSEYISNFCFYGHLYIVPSVYSENNLLWKLLASPII